MRTRTQPTLNVVTDKELVDFVDRLGVQTHPWIQQGKIQAWFAWLPHPHPFVKVHGRDWRTCIERLLEYYKRSVEDTPA